MGFSKPQKGTIKIHGLETFKNTNKLLGEVGYLPGEPSIPKGLDGWGFLRMMQGMRDERNDERLNYLLDLFKLAFASDNISFLSPKFFAIESALLEPLLPIIK